MEFKKYIADIKDFPEEGIIFRDVTPLLKDKEEIIKSNKTNVISLKLQNDKYRELIKKYEEKLD